MCNCQSAVVKDSPWDIFLKHWKDLKLDDLRPKQMVFFYNTAWPWYKLGDQEVQSKDGSLNSDAILQLDLYCHCLGKWSEMPYVKVFFQLPQDPKCGPLATCYY